MKHGEIKLNGETINRQVLGAKTLDEVADGMALLPDGSRAIGIFKAEFERRKTQAAVDAATAQEKSAKYILWSVIAIAVASVITAIATVS